MPRYAVMNALKTPVVGHACCNSLSPLSIFQEQVYKRDVSEATLEDKFDKTVLPKVMQVRLNTINHNYTL